MTRTILLDPLTLLVKYNLIDQGNGTIYDTRTKLTWQQTSLDETYTWKDAHKYCKQLRLAGHKDWRLPTIEELKTLIILEHQPTICPIFECKASYYWSSSSLVRYASLAWDVDFDDGFVNVDYGDDPFYVRAVRG